MEPLVLDVWSDIVCPWCYVGHRRLERALVEEPPGSVVVRHRAFGLDPTIPREGRPFKQHYEAKFGARAADLHAHMTATGAQEGIAFAFDAIPSVPNSFDLHRLVAVAGEQERPEMLQRLFAAYFEQGVDMSDLAAVLDHVGAGEDVRARLEGGEGAEEVQEDMALAHQAGLHAVPAFVAHMRLALTGAHEPELLRKFLAAARAQGPDAAAA